MIPWCHAMISFCCGKRFKRGLGRGQSYHCSQSVRATVGSCADGWVGMNEWMEISWPRTAQARCSLSQPHPPLPGQILYSDSTAACRLLQLGADRGEIALSGSAGWLEKRVCFGRTRITSTDALAFSSKKSGLCNFLLQEERGQRPVALPQLLVSNMSTLLIT